MAKGRNLRSRPAGGRDADGLRPGRDLDPRRAVRRCLPHPPPVLVLPQGRSGRGRGTVVVRGWEAVVRSEGRLFEVDAACPRRGAAPFRTAPQSGDPWMIPDSMWVPDPQRTAGHETNLLTLP